MKKLALLLLALPLSACASVNPGCAYAWVDQSCGQYYLAYQYLRLAPGNYADGPAYINGTGAPLATTHWGMASGDGAYLAPGAAVSMTSNPVPGTYGGR